MREKAVSVSALNGYVKRLLESDDALSSVWIEGEISGFKLYPSGHMYFTLKDEKASVRAIMFKTYASKIRFIPKDGMKIAAPCSVSLYEKDGSFRICVYDMFPIGAGSAQKELDALKDKLAAEGLFSQQRKRALPRSPSTIAVITSASGAVIHDIESVTARRNPFVRLLLYPVSVQGVYAAHSIKRALAAVNEREDIDLVIVARGGGSREDLWYFNDEGIVRAAAALRVPFISAVGHEVDTTLIDLAADLRAPTPSAAAELAVPCSPQLLADVGARFGACGRAFASGLAGRREALSALGERLERLTRLSLEGRREKLCSRAALLKTLDPVGVISRGYAVLKRDGKIVSSAGEVEEGGYVDILLRDGSVTARAVEVTKNDEIRTEIEL